MSATAKRSAVSGMSCIRPCAFFGERALGSKLDSARMIAKTSRGSTLYSRAWATTAWTSLRRAGVSGAATKVAGSSTCGVGPVLRGFFTIRQSGRLAAAPGSARTMPARRAATSLPYSAAREKREWAMASLRATPRPLAYIQPSRCRASALFRRAAWQ